MKKALRVVLAILFILFWMINLWIKTPHESDETFYALPPESACDEFMDSLSSPVRERIIQRSWKAYQYEAYCTRYGALEQTSHEGKQFRHALEVPWDGDFLKFWNSVYHYLHQQDLGKLTVLQDSLHQIAINGNLSRSDFADLIVSFVQDIPYEFVLPGECTGKETKPCNGNILYGIYSPSEFVFQLKGDCDTRTVLLYTLLENLGFDAVIFNSQQYEHSMLGIDLPSTGDFIRYKGKQFYFWETTNIGWMHGVLPPSMNSVKYWNIVLD
jgi:hypothetical protein